MNRAGPITLALEEEVKHELRQRGIVVWLDKSASYTKYVDNLVLRYQQKDFPFPVIPFRGSYLEMVLAAEHFGNALDREPLLIHMPGHTEETIRKTWVLELYAAGYRYRRSLETLVRDVATGRVAPDKIDDYSKNHLSDITAAETWLQEETAQVKKGLEGHLESLTPEWVLDGLIGKDKILKEKIVDVQTLEILIDYLYRQTGMDKAFRDFFNKHQEPSFDNIREAFVNIREAFVAWVMCVEYVHDLAHPPHLDALKPLRQISGQLRKICIKLVGYLREHHPDLYATYAEITEAHLQDELETIAPEDLGRIDTFRLEEERILEGAVQSLHTDEWDKALKWSQERISADSFWLNRDPHRRIVWSLVSDAAELGSLLDKARRPLKGFSNHDEILEYYCGIGFKIDTAHRCFEQQRLKLFDSKLPHFGKLLEAANRLRRLYRKWADDLAEDFADICSKEGFIPDTHLQQREIYDQVVHPLTKGDQKVAYFLIDAFRFEMAAELAREFERAGTHVILKGRYGELPTITAVGMNVLAPLSKSGKLTLAGGKGFTGFKTGEYTVRSPEERVRAMGDKSIDNISAGRKRTRRVSLSDVCDWPTTSLKKSCSNADLIVVHGKEIDDAGEANVGLASFETWLRQIKAAWNHLNSIGVNEFVFTADHGFLLQDHTTEEKPYGSKRDPNRRYVLSNEPRSEEGMVNVSLNALGYEGDEGFLLFRRDTAVFATGKPGATFVHGGNSLQERIIPVLTVSHKFAANMGDSEYQFVTKMLPMVSGFSRIQVGIELPRKAQLTFAAPQSVALALRVPNRPDVQVTIKEVKGAQLINQSYQLKVGQKPVEVLFDLSGPRDERVRLEIFHPDNIENIKSRIVDAYFNVSGTVKDYSDDWGISAADQDWQDSFEDDAVKRVFIHLYDHGSITEPEMNKILGSPRKVRRFSLAFEDYTNKVPFSVKIETGGSGKRYVKE